MSTTSADTTAAADGARGWRQVVLRVSAALLGSYAFVWGLTSLAITLGVAAGMRYSEIQAAAFLVAFLVFLTCFCWAFVARRVSRVWIVLGGGGAAMTLAAALVAR